MPGTLSERGMKGLERCLSAASQGLQWKRPASGIEYPDAPAKRIAADSPNQPQAACGTALQAQAPERPIAGGLATPALLSQVLVSKYCDYTPLFRQSQIFARHGLDLPR